MPPRVNVTVGIRNVPGKVVILDLGRELSRERAGVEVGAAQCGTVQTENIGFEKII